MAAAGSSKENTNEEEFQFVTFRNTEEARLATERNEINPICNLRIVKVLYSETKKKFQFKGISFRNKRYPLSFML